MRVKIKLEYLGYKAKVKMKENGIHKLIMDDGDWWSVISLTDMVDSFEDHVNYLIEKEKEKSNVN